MMNNSSDPVNGWKRLLNQGFDNEFSLFSKERWQEFIEDALTLWKNHELSPAEFYSIVKLTDTYLNNIIDSDASEKPYETPVDIVYFDNVLPNGALFLGALLKSMSYSPHLIPVGHHLEDWLRIFDGFDRSFVFVSLFHFVHIKSLIGLVAFLQKRRIDIILGGAPFEYDKSLASRFVGCIVPKDINELKNILSQIKSRGEKWKLRV